MEEKKFENLSTDDGSWINNDADIFQDLWELNFSDLVNDWNIVTKEVNPLVITLKVLTVSFWIILFLSIWFFLHVFVKTTDATFISWIPWVCDYIWANIDWYDNSEDCKNFNEIKEEISKNKENYETNIVRWLILFIPKAIKTEYILSSQEVKFILEKTNSKKVSLLQMIDEFEKIRISAWLYQWKNIECSSYSYNNKWIFSVKCDFYWASLNDSSLVNSLTSRWIMLDFLNKIQSSDSNFILQETPKSLSIWKFNSSDWILAVFSTVTSATFNFKYSLLSK